MRLIFHNTTLQELLLSMYHFASITIAQIFMPEMKFVYIFFCYKKNFINEGQNQKSGFPTENLQIRKCLKIKQPR